MKSSNKYYTDEHKKRIRCRYVVLAERSPRHAGCKSGNACPFAHPDDPTWAEARTPKLFNNKHDDRSPLRSRFNGRGRDYDYETEYERERNYDRTVRRRSRSIQRSPSPSENTRRRQRSYSPVTSSSKRREDRSPSGSREKYKANDSISCSPERDRRESRTQAKAILPTPPATGVGSTTTAYSPRIAEQEDRAIPGLSSVTSPPTAPRGMRQVQLTDASQTSSSNSQPTASPKTMPLIPPPEAPPPKEPLGPPPPIPEGLTLDVSAPPEQPDDGAKRKLADDQITLVSKAVKAMFDIQELEEERVHAATVVEAQNFSALPEVVQERMRGQLAVIEEKLLTANVEFAQLKEGYINAAFWPGKPPSISDEAAAAEEFNQKSYETIVKYVKDLNTDLSEIIANIPLLKDKNLHLSMLTEDDVDATNNTRPESDMDVDQEGDEHAVTSRQSTTGNDSSNRKRRRLTTDVDGFARPNSQENVKVWNEELEELRSKLDMLGTSVRNMENEMNAHNVEVEDTIVNVINSQYEAALNEQTQELRALGRRRKEKEHEQDDAIDTARRELSEAKEEMTQLASASTLLFKEISDVRTLLDQQNDAKNYNLARLTKLDERLQQYSAKQETNEARSKTLRAALNAYTRPLPSSPQTVDSVTTPPADYVSLALRDSIEAEVRAQLQLHIEKHRAEVASQIEKGNAAIGANVWESTDRLRSLVSVVSGILDPKQQKSPKRSPQQRNASAGPSSEGSLNEP